MAALGEEEEEEDVAAEDLPPTRYDTAVRERELASQKARIVSEMAAGERRSEPLDDRYTEVKRSSPRKQPLGPATTVQSTRSVPAPVESKSSGKQRAVDVPTRHSDTPGLFESVGLLLSEAFELADTEQGYSSPGKFSGCVTHS